eukprot:4765770-Pleurochrysis_carterae.AAC.2
MVPRQHSTYCKIGIVNVNESMQDSRLSEVNENRNAMLCTTGGSHTSRRQADKPKKYLFAICKAAIYRKKERLKASTTEHCTQNVKRHAVLSEWGARSRRYWGIVSTAVFTPRSRGCSEVMFVRAAEAAALL